MASPDVIEVESAEAVAIQEWQQPTVEISFDCFRRWLDELAVVAKSAPQVLPVVDDFRFVLASLRR